MAELNRRWTTYNYGNDNPIRFIDPDGRSTEDWLKANGLTQNDLTTVYQAPPDPPQEDQNQDEGNAGDQNSLESNSTSETQCCIVKAIGPAKHQKKPEKVDEEQESKEKKAEELAEKVDQIGTYASAAGIASDVTHEIMEAKKFIKGATTVFSYGTILVGTAADIYLSTHKDPKTGKPFQSWKMTGANGAVAVVAVVVGGEGGIAVEAVWFGGKMVYQYEKQLEKLPFREAIHIISTTQMSGSGGADIQYYLKK